MYVFIIYELYNMYLKYTYVIQLYKLHMQYAYVRVHRALHLYINVVASQNRDPFVRTF